MIKFSYTHGLTFVITALQNIWFVLFSFRVHLALHFERSPLSRSEGYDSADGRPNCFAIFTLTPESFMQYAGKFSFCHLYCIYYRSLNRAAKLVTLTALLNYDLTDAQLLLQVRSVILF